MKYSTTAILITALFIAFGATTFAQPGSLDDTFGTNGMGTYYYYSGPNSYMGNFGAIASDGKIVLTGRYSYNYNMFYRFATARINTDGSIDNSFGLNSTGIDLPLSSAYFANATSVLFQPDEKIVVAGSSGPGYNETAFTVIRYDMNGVLDTTFSGDGFSSAFYPGLLAKANSASIQQDGKIVLAGYAQVFSTSVYGFALARFNTDGVLDSLFGVNGTITNPFEHGALGYAVALQSDGKIVMSGTVANDSLHIDFALARFKANGDPDSSFGGYGLVSTSFGSNYDYGNSVAIQPDGKIVVAGYTSTSYNLLDADFALARYNTNGDLDSTFGVDGKVSTDVSTSKDFGRSVAIQPDGKIVVVGFSEIGNTSVFAVVRYNMDGSLDNTFGLDGKVTTAIGTYAEGNSVTLQPDGKIVVIGTAGNDFAVVRYLSDLTIGVVEFTQANTAPLIYPNPIASHATLKYTLQTAEAVSIALLDMQGKMVQTFMEGEHQAAGEHQQAIDLPEALAKGTYLIAISSPKGKVTVQVVK